MHLATIDLLVVRPHDHDGDNPVAWDQQATDLTTATHHWSSNPTHLQLREPTEAGAVDGHDTAADWWLLAGTAAAGSPPDHPRYRSRRPNRRSVAVTAARLADVRTAAAQQPPGAPPVLLR